MNRIRGIVLAAALVVCMGTAAQKSIVREVCWIDGNFNTAETASSSIDISTLTEGLHSYSIRVQDSDGVWSSPMTKFFIIPQEDQTATAITEQEYWIDGKVTTRTTLEASPAQISLVDLAAGLHSLAIRVKDDTGVWSSPMTKFFIIPQEEQSAAITRYVYWIDDDKEHVVSGTMTDVSGILTVNIGELSEGEHTLSWCVADSKSAWSSVKTETFIFTRTAITMSMVSLVQNSYEYTAADIEPELNVVDGTTTLIKDDDYEVTYADNCNTGTAIATVTGKAAYKESVDVQFTITKAPLTIKAKDYTIKQGEVLPTLEIEYEGFKNNESSSILTVQPATATEATSASEPGDYVITVSGATAENYELVYVDGTLTITEADPVTITAQSYEIEYGDILPTFEFSSEGAELKGTPSITCDVPSGAPAGTYSIVISKGDVTNYNDTYVNGTLAIKKALLTITADDIEVHQDEAMPTLTWKAEGWKNEEDESVLIAQPVCTTEGSPSSSEGEYVISVSGAEGANYEFTYVPGKLTVLVPTGIAEIDMNVAPSDIYTLQGVKVRSKAESMDGLAEGFYIVNGRKFFIRKR